MNHSQRGATLFVALIMLLVITLLALSGARETALEGRITGHFVEQQNLLNLSEAALREGEQSLTTGTSPVQNYACAEADSYCLVNITPSYTQDFSTAKSYTPTSGASNQSMLWYALPADTGDASGQSLNPEYGNMMMGIGTFTYEVNVRARDSSTEQQTRLRSTITKIFN
jgi:type IV pilus assembly protein PilX